MSDVKQIIADAKQWIEQEKVWDGELYATASRSPSSPTAIGGGSMASPPVTAGNDVIKEMALKTLYEKYKDCTRCDLGHTRIKFVFGVGDPNAEVLFIGEGPGYEEDRKGEPFVGKAGQLLDKMMAAINLSRQKNAYIANIVKCHPMAHPETPEAHGNDRPPTPDEVETCSPILLQQIAILKPKVIMTLGSPSTKMILHTTAGITGLRGKLVSLDVDHFYPEDPEVRQALKETKVLPTYHPAALLRNPDLKADAWTDLKLLRDMIALK